LNIRSSISATKLYLSKYGIAKTIRKVCKSLYNRIFRKQSFYYQNERYQNWIKNNEPTLEELEKQRKTEFKIICVKAPRWIAPFLKLFYKKDEH